MDASWDCWREGTIWIFSAGLSEATSQRWSKYGYDYIQISFLKRKIENRSLMRIPKATLFINALRLLCGWQRVGGTRPPYIERRQEEDTHEQVNDQAADNYDREWPLRIGAD